MNKVKLASILCGIAGIGSVLGNAWAEPGLPDCSPNRQILMQELPGLGGTTGDLATGLAGGRLFVALPGKISFDFMSSGNWLSFKESNERVLGVFSDSAARALLITRQHHGFGVYRVENAGLTSLASVELQYKLGSDKVLSPLVDVERVGINLILLANFHAERVSLSDLENGQYHPTVMEIPNLYPVSAPGHSPSEYLRNMAFARSGSKLVVLRAWDAGKTVNSDVSSDPAGATFQQDQSVAHLLDGFHVQVFHLLNDSLDALTRLIALTERSDSSLVTIGSDLSALRDLPSTVRVANLGYSTDPNGYGIISLYGIGTALALRGIPTCLITKNTYSGIAVTRPVGGMISALLVDSSQSVYVSIRP